MLHSLHLSVAVGRKVDNHYIRCCDQLPDDSLTSRLGRIEGEAPCVAVDRKKQSSWIAVCEGYQPAVLAAVDLPDSYDICSEVRRVAVRKCLGSRTEESVTYTSVDRPIHRGAIPLKSSGFCYGVGYVANAAARGIEITRMDSSSLSSASTCRPHHRFLIVSPTPFPSRRLSTWFEGRRHG